MSLDRNRIERKRLLRFARRGSQVLFPKSKRSQCQMKAGFIACVEAAELLFGVLKFLLIARGLDHEKHRSLMSRRSFENCEGLLPGLLKLPCRHENEGQFLAGVDVIGKQFPRFQKEGCRAQRSALFIPYNAEALNCGCILRIGSEHV